MPSDRPRALDHLDLNEAKDGLIVYDPTADRVHHLNATAAVVLTCCDGEHDAPAIARIVAAAVRLDDAPLADVERCLREFATNGLVR